MNKMPVSIEFTEDMKGFVAADVEDYEQGFKQGKKARRHSRFMFHLTIKIPDVDFFIRDPEARGTAEGYVEWAGADGRLQVRDGVFNCFVDVDEPKENIRHMKYRLFVEAKDGQKFTVSGHKIVKDDGASNIWRDTSTLYTQILDGHVAEDQEDDAKPLALGILRIKIADFARQLTTFRSNGATVEERVQALAKFGRFFMGTLWETYGPQLRSAEKDLWPLREIPIYSLEGVKDAAISTHYIATKDNLQLSVLRFERKPCDDVVVLLHGLSTSTDMFIMPEHENLVSYLLDHGYTDVWSLDWRGSMRHNYDLFPNRYNFDDVALYDHPAAFDHIRKTVGEGRRIHVICHCVGSITFMMSLFGGAVEGITSVVSNSVSLTPRVTNWCKLKLKVAPFFVTYVLRFPYVSPKWATFPGIAQGKFLAKLVSLFHPECDVPACHMVSFMWGSGRPGCYEHENLTETTHRRVGDLFGSVSLNFYRHVNKMVGNGKAVKMRPTDPRYDSLPNNYLEHAKRVQTPILFISGTNNRVFPGSNKVTYDTLTSLNSGNHYEYKEFEGYGHQDVFMGKSNDQDVFPALTEFLDRARLGVAAA